MRFLFFLCLFPGLMLHAQIVIDRYDMPQSNDIFNTAVKNFYNGSFSQAGADFTWDFSALTSSSSRVDSFVSIFSTNVAYNIVFNPFVANVAYHTATLPGWIPGITIDDNFDFFYNTSNGYEKAGFGAVVNGIPTPIRYSNSELWFTYPLAYGQQTSSVSSWGMPIPGIGYFGQRISRTNEADGWGTLILPNNTSEVLRIHSVINTRDTIFYDDQQFGFTTNRPKVEEYYWIAKNQGMPLLTIRDEGLFNKTCFYRIFDPQTGIGENEKAAVFCGPNPTDGNFVVRLPNNADTASLQVTDMTGRVVFRDDFQGSYFVADISGLPAAVYNITITTLTSSFCQKIALIH